MNRIHSNDIKRAEEGFIQWIKNTENCAWTHHLNLKSWLENDKKYKDVTDIHSFMTAIMWDDNMSKRELWKVIDLYKFYLENEL